MSRKFFHGFSNSTIANIVGTNITSGTINATTMSSSVVNSTTITSANIYASNNLFVGGTLTTVNITSTNLLQTNVSATNIAASSVTTGTLNVTGAITAGGHFVPSANITHDLGSANLRWRDLYLSGNTIDLGGLQITNSSSGSIRVTDTGGNLQRFEASEIRLVGTDNQPIILKASGGNLNATNVSNQNIALSGSTGGAVSLTDVSSHIVPVSNGNYDIGSSTNRFRNIYMAGNLISFGSGISFDTYDWSYLANYVIPPRVAANSDSTVTFTGVGQEHSAYIFQGNLFTFGRNNFGQLGHGDSTNRTVPIQVSGITGAAAVACGESFTVVLMANGTVKACGFNSNGQLGDGTTTNRSTFVDIPGITTATQVSCGINYTLILLSDGTVVGFGSNALGQLGNGSTSTTNTSAVSMTLPSATARFISCGAYFSIVLLNNGAAYGCGDNSYGQLALDPAVNATSTSLVLISGVSNVTSAECGQYHTVLVTYLGNVVTVGRNDTGQLGIGNKSSFVRTLNTVITQGTSGSLGLSTLVGAGLNHTVVIRGDNSIYAWGSNLLGQLGLGQSTTEALTPTLLPGGFTGYSVGCGKQHTVIRVNPDPTYVGRTTTLISFGDNAFGQMGDNNPNIPIRWFPNRINDGTYAKTLFRGQSSTETLGYIDSDGVAYMSGNTGTYERATGYIGSFARYQYRPHSISTFDTRLIQVTSESDTDANIGLDKNGQVWTWGREINSWGKLGTGTSSTVIQTQVPYNITSTGSLVGRVITTVDTGYFASGCIDSTGQVHTWGYRQHGALGDNTMNTTVVPTPQNISSLGTLSGRSAVDLRFGGYHGVILDTTGRVHTFGQNAYGQCGNGSTTTGDVGSGIPVAIQVTGGTLAGKTVVGIAAGFINTLAIDSAGAVHAWGYGGQGNLGRGTADSNVPIQVTGGSLAGKTVTAISSGIYHNLALDSTGRVHTWGYNGYGQIGNSTTNQQTTPIAVTGGSIAGKTIVSISANGSSSLAIDSEGSVHAWGRNSNGQLGDGTTTNRVVPVLIDKTSRDTHLPQLSDGAGYHKLICNTTAGNIVSNVMPLGSFNGNATGGTLLRAIGSNTNRQIGDNTTTRRYYGVDITNFTGGYVVSSANSQYHSAVVLSNGAVFAWGRNNYGQCGNTVGSDIGVPTPVSGINYGAEVALGEDFTIVRNQDNSIFAFGRNNVGQLGISTTTVSTSTFTPTYSTVTGITHIETGPTHAMGVTTQGSLYVWGDNSYGKLGISSGSAFIDTPTLVSGATLNFSKVSKMGLGQHFSIISCTDRTVYSAGLNNLGQLGRSTNFGTTASNTAFTRFTLGSYEMTPIKISCGDAHTAMLMSNNQIMVWGDNSNNQAPGSQNSWTPVLLENMIEVMNVSASKDLTHVEFFHTNRHISTLGVSRVNSFGGRRSRIGLGYSHSVYLDESQRVWSWGYNDNGQLGNNAVSGSQGSPQIITSQGTLNGNTIVDVVGGPFCTHFLDITGRIHSTGYNGTGQLGSMPTSTSQSNVPVLSTAGTLAGKTIISVVSGNRINGCSAALDSTGTVHVWGDWANGNGAGNTGGTIYPPVSITGGSLAGKRVVQIVVQNYAGGLALASDGSIHSWGKNGGGATCTLVSLTGTLTGQRVISIGGGNNNSALSVYAIDNFGRLHARGDNQDYSLGDGTTTNRSTFVLATGSLSRPISKITGTILGDSAPHTTALDMVGNVHQWGYSDGTYFPILGQNSTQTVPIIVRATFDIDIAQGYLFSAALNNSGNILTWGHNGNGQIGDGTRTVHNGTGYNVSTSRIGAGTSNTSGPYFVNFTGQHRCFVDGIETLNIKDYEGLIVVSNNNTYVTLDGENKISINESLPLVSLCTTPQSKKSFGVISLKSDSIQLDDITKTKLKESGDIRVEINSIGEGAIWVCDETGPLESGDYITTASVPGYGMKQADDILHNYTVAKMTMDCDFSNPMYPEKRIKKDDYNNNVLDESGKLIWETITESIQDPENPEVVTIQTSMKPFYQMRYLDQDANQITKEEYNTRKANGDNTVYRAAFVGCTYHCG